MTANHYIRRETLVNVAINCFFAALFFFVVFGGQDRVPVWGLGNWVFDFIPQSFMIALLGTIIPGALAAKRLGWGNSIGRLGAISSMLVGGIVLGLQP